MKKMKKMEKIMKKMMKAENWTAEIKLNVPFFEQVSMWVSCSEYRSLSTSDVQSVRKLNNFRKRVSQLGKNFFSEERTHWIASEWHTRFCQ